MIKLWKSLKIVSIACMILAITFIGNAKGAKISQSDFFEIQVVDSVTGKGIPAVELKATNDKRFITDSAGRIRINDLYMMNQTVFFDVTAHGYEKPPADFIGIRGFRVDVVLGGNAVLKLDRINIAERLYRITGSDIYRDSVLLGKTTPIEMPIFNAYVASHDNIYLNMEKLKRPMNNAQTIVYNGKIYWFFGATQGLGINQKNLHITLATSELPSMGGLDPAQGVNLRYFTQHPDGFVKEMFPFGARNDVVWVDGVMVVPDEKGKERLVVYYQIFSDWNRKEHGLAVFDDKKEVFKKYCRFDLDEDWRIPSGRSFNYKEGEKEWLYFGKPFPNVRVPADLKSICDPKAYEAWTCLIDGSSMNSTDIEVLRDSDTNLVYRWTTKASPVGAEEEEILIEKGVIEANEGRLLPVDVDSNDGKQVVASSGMISWNPWRERWVLIATQKNGSSSEYGEIWYSESMEPIGPWKKAKKIVTHDNYSFINPIHHEFLDQKDGRVIYFEGTYTNAFAINKEPTMLYNNNRIMYRLDLSDSRLNAVWE